MNSLRFRRAMSSLVSYVARKPPAAAPGGDPGRAPGGPSEGRRRRNRMRYMLSMRLTTKLKTAFKRHPNLENACIRMPWDVLELSLIHI